MTAPASTAPVARPRVAVVGGGPAGLMACEVLAAGGVQVDLYDAMPTPGRKFLLAGKGGLNLTHSEPAEHFVTRYPAGREQVASWLAGFDAAAVRSWAAGLGVSTFVGSSGRVFPHDMKSAPLLRRWLQRLRESGVRLHTRHRWTGWSDAAASALRFESRSGPIDVQADAAVLALGGASWPQLGSDAAWVPLLAGRGVGVAPLRPSNCGFDVARPVAAADVPTAEPALDPAAPATAPGAHPGAGHAGGMLLPGWSEHLRRRWAGTPLKTVGLCVGDPAAARFRRRGEFVLTDGGVEGSLVYAAAPAISGALEAHGVARVHLDLLPDRSLDDVRRELHRPRGPRSLSTHLKSRLGLGGAKAALLHELLPRASLADAEVLAAAIKSLPLVLVAARPVAEAISSAGGVEFDALDERLMLRRVPGLFCAGEMLDWDAPTGGYLLTACMASGAVAARGALAWLGEGAPMSPEPGRADSAPASAGAA